MSIIGWTLCFGVVSTVAPGREQDSREVFLTIVEVDRRIFFSRALVVRHLSYTSETYTRYTLSFLSAKLVFRIFDHSPYL